MQPTLDRHFVDLDPIFNHNLDEDFDFRASGVTRSSFCSVYMDWIQFCCVKRTQQQMAQQTAANAAANASQQTATNTLPTTAASSTIASKRTSPISSTNPTPSPRDKAKSLKSEAKEELPQLNTINMVS